jgi:hypothetical protein
MTTSPLTKQEYLMLMKSAQQVHWAAEVSISMVVIPGGRAASITSQSGGRSR